MIRIAINVGHKPTEPGAIDGVEPAENDYRYSREESDNNRLSGFVCSRLLREGFEVRIFQQGIAEPLKAIAARIVENKPDLFFSLHRNAVSAKKARGWSVWYHELSCAGKRLAGMLVEELKVVKGISPDPANCLRTDYEIYPQGGFAVLRHTKNIPGCLFEGGFVTNPLDEIWYDSAAILYDMAGAFVRCVNHWLMSR